MKYEAAEDEDLTTALRALAHPARLSILRILSRNGTSACCCNEVAECLPLAQSTVSQHIKVLLDAGLIERKPSGTRNCYLVRADRLTQAMAALDAFVAALVVVDTEIELSESA
ncbi:MAG: metalloregulator ArsR/SmtB family transcription factor [Alphaproteobacteria bacterium]|nr:metalloregulator ArsR/SmtB family transcription factor [Alphaproteobacteria bacterium]